MTPSSSEIVWRHVHWPTPLDGELALGLLHRLAADTSRPPVVWEVRATEGIATHLVGTAAHYVRDLCDAIESLLPDTATSATDDSDRPNAEQSAKLAIRGQALPLETDRGAQASRAILGALASARFEDEHAVLQVALGTGFSARTAPAKQPDPTQGFMSLLGNGARVASTELVARIRDKRGEAGFRAVIRVAAVAKTQGRRETILRNVLSAIRTLQAPGVRIDFAREPSIAVDEARVPRRLPLELSSSEVLSLLAWPLDAVRLPGMPSAHPRQLKLIGAATTGRTFAETSAPGTRLPLGIPIDQALFHTVAIGPTGAGKSTALLNLIIADLRAGRSIVVIDPKADLVREVLERVPSERREDIAVLDPTDASPVGLNPLDSTSAAPELVADAILTVFRDLFPSAFGPRTSDVLHASMLTLARHPGATLTWLPKLLTDTKFRASIIGHQQDDLELSSFWAQYGAMSERQQAQHVGPALSRLRQFLLRPSLKRVLDQPEPRFHLEELFTSPRVLLVPLNTGLLGNDAARLLGSLLVGQLWQLTLARAGVPPASRRPVSVYIDEAQEFLRLGGELADALARSRSLGVAWHVAHQYRDQLPPEMRSAIDANARNKIVFGLGIKDAKDMANMAPTLLAEDFMALPKHAVYANLMRDGEQTGWISGTTLPAPNVCSDANELIANSRERFGALPTDSANATETPNHEPSALTSESPIGRRPRASS
jgi:hypothetical protein